eukprot:Sspe_Gene.113017::Locus_96888_Transcript_1_1_Confidence_1.000_Length_1424::g.113017::m.113017
MRPTLRRLYRPKAFSPEESLPEAGRPKLQLHGLTWRVEAQEDWKPFSVPLRRRAHRGRPVRTASASVNREPKEEVLRKMSVSAYLNSELEPPVPAHHIPRGKDKVHTLPDPDSLMAAAQAQKRLLSASLGLRLRSTLQTAADIARDHTEGNTKSEPQPLHPPATILDRRFHRDPTSCTTQTTYLLRIHGDTTEEQCRSAMADLRETAFVNFLPEACLTPEAVDAALGQPSRDAEGVLCALVRDDLPRLTSKARDRLIEVMMTAPDKWTLGTLKRLERSAMSTRVVGNLFAADFDSAEALKELFQQNALRPVVESLVARIWNDAAKRRQLQATPTLGDVVADGRSPPRVLVSPEGAAEAAVLLPSFGICESTAVLPVGPVGANGIGDALKEHGVPYLTWPLYSLPPRVTWLPPSTLRPLIAKPLEVDWLVGRQLHLLEGQSHQPLQYQVVRVVKDHH